MQTQVEARSSEASCATASLEEIGWLIEAADLVHGFDGMLPAAAALELATSDDAAMALVEATPADAVGADGRTPLHHAAAFARSAALARRLLAFEPAWAKRADAGGKLPIELLPSTASEEQATVLFEASGMPADTPLWVMRLPRRPSARPPRPRAAVEADPDAAARPFAAPEGWAPTEGRARAAATRAGREEGPARRRGGGGHVRVDIRDGEGWSVKRLRDGKPREIRWMVHPRGRPRARLRRYAPRGGGARARHLRRRGDGARRGDARGRGRRRRPHAAAPRGGVRAAARPFRAVGGARARRLLAFEPAWAKRADAGGKSAFELLPSTASEEQATVLFEASGPRPLWVMLDPATAACSAASARDAVEADPDAATRPFAAPSGLGADRGRARAAATRAGREKGLRAGEVAAVTTCTTADGAAFNVKRLRDGKPEETRPVRIPAADLVHGFDGMLPAAAALALATSDDAAMALVEATPADAVGADGRTPLHHAAAFARSAALARRLLAFEPAWAKRVDAGGKSAFELLPSTASEEQATVLFEACGGTRGRCG